MGELAAPAARRSQLPGPALLLGTLDDERLTNARLTTTLRLAGVTLVCLIALVLALIKGRPEWLSALRVLAGYWPISLLLFWLVRRRPRYGLQVGLGIALVDVPLAYVVQLAALKVTPNPGAAAAFTLGVFCLFIGLAALSIQRWLIMLVAVLTSACQVHLLASAGVTRGGWVAAVVVLGLMALVSWSLMAREARLYSAEQRKNELGGYRLLHRIGSGGMAEVFVAVRIGPAGFTKQVAIKRILPHLAEDPHFVAMFLDEARLAARLSHPGIVEIRELGDDHGQYFMVMEYVDGVSLDLLLKRARHRTVPCPHAALIEIGVLLLEALHHAHLLADELGNSLHIVHRDVTPQNVMVARHRAVKLLDFGIARATQRSSHTRTGTIRGKLPYMSPEQAGAGDLDGRSDLFSLSVVLYELACLRRPFEGRNDYEILYRIRTAPVIPPSTLDAGFPLGLEAILLRGLAKDPADRFASAGAMAEALRAHSREAPGASGTEQLARWAGALAGWPDTGSKSQPAAVQAPLPDQDLPPSSPLPPEVSSAQITATLLPGSATVDVSSWRETATRTEKPD